MVCRFIVRVNHPCLEFARGPGSISCGFFHPQFWCEKRVQTSIATEARVNKDKGCKSYISCKPIFNLYICVCVIIYMFIFIYMLLLLYINVIIYMLLYIYVYIYMLLFMYRYVYIYISYYIYVCVILYICYYIYML